MKVFTGHAVPLGRLPKPAGAEMEDRLSSPTLSRSSLSLREWRQRCSRSLGARKALGSKFSRGNLTIFWDLIQRPFTNWKRFKWTIYTSEHVSDAVSKFISRENVKCYQHPRIVSHKTFRCTSLLLTSMGGSLQRSSFLVASRWVLHLEQ